ncbi:MAG: cupin domain-containing protein [Chloroflexi bacterium]|nr:cupin domain-containing protein [Chloroflexota bacterium]
MATGYKIHQFLGITGYLIAPWLATTADAKVAVRHSAGVQPWRDSDVHLHETAVECFLVCQGQLRLLIAEVHITLNPGEFAMIHPQIPHAVTSGEGSIEHFVIRAPAINDRISLYKLIDNDPAICFEDQRVLAGEWGCRVALKNGRFQNCWLLGTGTALFTTPHISLAYLSFATHHDANKDMNARQKMHRHQCAFEYYAVIQGTKTVQFEKEQVRVQSGEILEIPPGAWHVVTAREAPYQGMTFRVPAGGGDKELWTS